MNEIMEGVNKRLGQEPLGETLYKIIREKLRSWTPPITQILNKEYLGEVIRELFLQEENEDDSTSQRENNNNIWKEELTVSQIEINKRNN